MSQSFSLYVNSNSNSFRIQNNDHPLAIYKKKLREFVVINGYLFHLSLIFQ